MRTRYSISAAVVVLTSLSFAPAALAAPRTVFVEAVTNLGSVGDAGFRHLVDQALGGQANCEYVVMDAWWPRAADPLFVAAGSGGAFEPRESGDSRPWWLMGPHSPASSAPGN